MENVQKALKSLKKNDASEGEKRLRKGLSSLY